MIVVTGYVCSRRDEAFLGWILGCIVFFLCLGSAGALRCRVLGGGSRVGTSVWALYLRLG
jgi:hypothetical protein